MDTEWITVSQIEKTYGITHVQRFMQGSEKKEYMFCGRKCHAYLKTEVEKRLKQRKERYKTAKQRYSKRPNVNFGTHSRLKKVLDKTLYMKLRNAWYGMMRRCYTDDRPDYHHYREQNISMCEEWLNSFDEFALWALDNGVQLNLSLDRINNDEGYNPNNCRWVTKIAQNNNSSQNITVVFRGEEKTIGEWAKELGIKYGTLYSRIVVNHWPPEKALTKVIHRPL